MATTAFFQKMASILDIIKAAPYFQGNTPFPGMAKPKESGLKEYSPGYISDPAAMNRIRERVASRVADMTQAAKPSALQPPNPTGGRPREDVTPEMKPTLEAAQAKPHNVKERASAQNQIVHQEITDPLAPKPPATKPSEFYRRAEEADAAKLARQRFLEAGESRDRAMMSRAHAGDVERRTDLARAEKPGGLERVAADWSRRLGHAVPSSQVGQRAMEAGPASSTSPIVRGESDLTPGERTSRQHAQAEFAGESRLGRLQQRIADTGTKMTPPTQSKQALAPHPAMVAAKKAAFTPPKTPENRPALLTAKDDATPEEQKEEKDETVPEAIEKTRLAMRKYFMTSTASVPPPNGGGVTSPGGNPHG